MRVQLSPGCFVIVLLGLAGVVVLLTMDLTWQTAATFGLFVVGVLVVVGVLYVRTTTKLAKQFVVAFTDPDKLREQAGRLAGHGMLQEAVQTQLQAIRLLEERVQEGRHDLARAHLWLGGLYSRSELRMHPQALDCAGRALAILREVPDEDGGEHLLLLANAHFTEGDVLLFLHRNEAALTAFTEAVDILRPLRMEEPSAAKGLAGALDGMAIALRRLDRFGEADQAATQAQEARHQAEP